MVKEGIRYNGGVSGKEPEVDGNISSRHIGGGIGFVLLLIKDTPTIGDIEDIIGLAESVECSVPTVSA
jgi:hypothetical protein